MYLTIGIDIGGVLSKYPDEFKALIRAFDDKYVNIYIISDMHPVDKIKSMLNLNGLGWLCSYAHSADFEKYGDECKAVLCRKLGVDILIDDHMAYLSMEDGPKVRLLVMPDKNRDYYHEDWKTDGTEGNFGRRRAKTS